ncbi:hypothetical protein NIIDNTM18_39610 [Mycolicibacterium litorale]|uniref:Uncharacterized protein n=1 Tax=Mycolicibacterium litorale TaxID=758802 RepID=A0A6S6P4B0_9MYCO|nr:hypothetical protein [Mycolicibacterium litorale]BCI54683.1 hypothetical protein NIIDNTM18_39610 [Mycolicibacterium litorale]
MPNISPDVAKYRASVARRVQSYPADHPRVTEARQALAYAALTEHAARVVASWPSPTEEQRANLAALLRSAGGMQ